MSGNPRPVMESERSYLHKPTSNGGLKPTNDRLKRTTAGSIRSTPRNTTQASSSNNKGSTSYLWRRGMSTRRTVAGKTTGNRHGNTNHYTSLTAIDTGSRIPVPNSLEVPKISQLADDSSPDITKPHSRLKPPGRLELDRSCLVTSTEVVRLPAPAAVRERTGSLIKPRTSSLRQPSSSSSSSSRPHQLRSTSSRHHSSPDSPSGPPLSLPSIPTSSSRGTSRRSGIPPPRIYSRNSSEAPPTLVPPLITNKQGRNRATVLLSPNTKNKRYPQPQVRPYSSEPGETEYSTHSSDHATEKSSPAHLPIKRRTQPLRYPLTPQFCKQEYGQVLSPYEYKEIDEYPEVWYLGLESKKIHAEHGASQNAGYDDDNGSYIKVLHDHISYRFEIREVIGKGSFGQVVKCFDHKTKQPVAIKIIRNKKRFHHQALVEVKILDSLRKKDHDNQFNIIHMIDYFYFRNHLCITFELMGMNLYELIKRNNFQGFSTSLIRRFAYTLLHCLKLLRRERIIHCDLKPENILLKLKGPSSIKVIDFGSSCYEHQRVYTYIQSRFYRSPEVILGMPYSMAIDMWSLGCILAELYTGYPLFPGENEVEQLSCIMEIFGVPSMTVLNDAQRKKLFFDSRGTPRTITNSKGRKRRPGTKDLSYAIKTTDVSFLDFIRQCLEWDPATRLTPEQALQHEFIKAGQFSRSRGLSRSIHITPTTQSTTTSSHHHHHGSHSHLNGYLSEDKDIKHSSPGDSKKRLQPIGAEVKTKYVDSSSSRQYNGLLKRSSFASDGLPVIRGSHGTVTLGTRRSSAADAVTTATCDPFVDGIGNGHTSSSSSSKYPLPPIV